MKFVLPKRLALRRHVETRQDNSTTTPSDLNSTSTSRPKYVVAHHMVGNTFSYTKQNWTDDVILANQSGIDGFALNMGRDDWQPARVADAYDAAQESGLDFKMFLSLDMTSLPCASTDDATLLRSLVTAQMSHLNQFKYGSSDRALVSTFAGESCTFGEASPSEGWRNQFVQHPDLRDKITFVPSFFVDPATFGQFGGVLDGDFNWNSGWPIELTTSFVQGLLQNSESLRQNAPAASTLLGSGAADDNLISKFIGSTDTDQTHLNGLKNLGSSSRKRQTGNDEQVYMAAVSPWFFTHYGPDTFNKNFIYVADQHLYPKRWESLIDARDSIDIVQVVSWNDWGESHYLSPVHGDQPNSQAWTDNMPHDGWLPLTKYYAEQFKTGNAPVVENDSIFMWSRPHSVNAQATADDVGQPTNFELLEDTIWAVALTTAPSTVTLSSSGNSQTFNVPAGLSRLSLPISPGGDMKGTIERDGKTVVELSPTNFTFQGTPSTFNFNAFVAMNSTAGSGI